MIPCIAQTLLGYICPCWSYFSPYCNCHSQILPDTDSFHLWHFITHQFLSGTQLDNTLYQILLGVIWLLWEDQMKTHHCNLY